MKYYLSCAMLIVKGLSLPRIVLIAHQQQHVVPVRSHLGCSRPRRREEVGPRPGA